MTLIQDPEVPLGKASSEPINLTFGACEVSLCVSFLGYGHSLPNDIDKMAKFGLNLLNLYSGGPHRPGRGCE
jgi:hypothetical protein